MTFFICWAPFHTQRLIFFLYQDQSKWSPALRTLMHVFFYLTGILYYISSVINPILYNIMSLKFRRAYKNTIFSPCRRDNSRRKRSSFIAYKFCRGHMEMDSDMSVYRLKQQDAPGSSGVNGVKVACNGCQHRSDSRSHSSGKGSGSQRGDCNNLVTGDSDTKIPSELKTNHSFTPRTAYTHLEYESRPYHSYA